MKRFRISSVISLLALPAGLLAEQPCWTGKGRPEKMEVYDHKEKVNAKHQYKQALKSTKDTDPNNKTERGKWKIGNTKTSLILLGPSAPTG